MPKFKPSDSVVVSLEGRDHPGEVIGIGSHTGYVMCRIYSDPSWHYDDNITVDPEQTVCVKPSDVRPAS